jgi:hypothetical protein
LVAEETTSVEAQLVTSAVRSLASSRLGVSVSRSVAFQAA